MGQFDADFADLVPKDTGRDFSADFKDLLPKDTGRDFSADFADLMPATKAPPAGKTFSQADVRKSEPAPDTLWDATVENVGGPLARGTEALQRENSMLSLLKHAKLLDDYAAIDRGEVRPELVGPMTSQPAKFYRTRSREQREAIKVEAQTNLVAAITDVAERSKTLKGMPGDPDVAKAMNAETIDEFWTAFKKQPLKFMANVSLESLPQMLPGLVAAVPAGLAAGPVGVAGAIGAGSATVDFSASTMEALVKRGVDLSDEAAIKKAVADPALLDEVKMAALKHAIPVGAFDAASVGALARRLGGAFVTQAMKQLGIQATLGAGGEAVGQHAAQEGYSVGQVAAEAAGEIAQAPFEAAAVGVSKAAQPSAAKQRAQVVATELAAAVEATDISAGTEQVAVEALRPENAQLQAVEISTPAAAVQQAIAEPIAETSTPSEAVPAVQAASGEEQAARSIPDLHAYADRVRGDVVADVELVGSTITGAVGKDTDLLYTFKDTALPADSLAAAAKVEAMIESTDIDLDANDTFVRVGDRYFHVSSGAGRQVVENTDYAAEQAGKPRVKLGREQTAAPTSIDEIPADLEISEPTLVEDTGETVQVKRNAREAFKEADQKVNRYRALIDCMGRG